MRLAVSREGDPTNELWVETGVFLRVIHSSFTSYLPTRDESPCLRTLDDPGYTTQQFRCPSW